MRSIHIYAFIFFTSLVTVAQGLGDYFYEVVCCNKDQKSPLSQEHVVTLETFTGASSNSKRTKLKNITAENIRSEATVEEMPFTPNTTEPQSYGTRLMTSVWSDSSGYNEVSLFSNKELQTGDDKEKIPPRVDGYHFLCTKTGAELALPIPSMSPEAIDSVCVNLGCDSVL